MSKPAERQRRQRGSIDPDEILDGAFAVARRVGLDNLSMPELASHLDVGVTSIYWYYRNKEDLLRRMSMRAISEFQARLPQPGERSPGEWRSYLAEYFRAQRRVFNEDELITDLTLVRTAAYSRRSTLILYQRVEDTLAYLMSAGFDARTAWYAYATCSTYLRGFVITERNRRANETPPPGELQLGLLDAQSMPLLSRLIVDEPIMLDMTGDRSFEFGLELLLDSLERLLSSHSRHTV